MTTTKTTSIRLMDPPERGPDEFTSLGEHGVVLLVIAALS